MQITHDSKPKANTHTRIHTHTILNFSDSSFYSENNEWSSCRKSSPFAVQKYKTERESDGQTDKNIQTQTDKYIGN